MAGKTWNEVFIFKSEIFVFKNKAFVFKNESLALSLGRHKDSYLQLGKQVFIGRIVLCFL